MHLARHEDDASASFSLIESLLCEAEKQAALAAVPCAKVTH
jgi:hypothetical protein